MKSWRGKLTLRVKQGLLDMKGMVDETSQRPQIQPKNSTEFKNCMRRAKCTPLAARLLALKLMLRSKALTSLLKDHECTI
ncbi:hypothetical protein NPIL_97361 [Nephila pilipes]|uniref:Uncharacterized protein n=1 Tax=Nephila pilipes TaxID=299642 RepID=A0A8X6NKP7_NEPPI|nr:hypothetical protein NPIL_97361 [Nephila pilipes]